MDSSTLKRLRSQTGLPLATCREALVAAEGDFDRSLNWLHQHGLYREPKLSGPSLRQAVANDEHERVARFLTTGGNVNETVAGVSLLEIACRCNAINVVRVLLAAGARREPLFDGGWSATQLDVLRVVADEVPPARLLRSLTASLTDTALAAGTEAATDLAQRLETARLEGREIVLRIAYCGCHELMQRWPEPSRLLSTPLSEQEAARYAPLFRGTSPRTARDLLMLRYELQKRVVETIEELKRKGDHVDSGEESMHRATLQRFEQCTGWLQQQGL